MNVLLLVALFSAAEFANGVPPTAVNFGIKSASCPPITEDTIGICAELCTADSTCSTGEKCCSNGCGHTCVAVKNDDNPCCFQYGFGARLVPCCLNVITCEEHDQLLEEIAEHPEQEPVGGAIGKHHFCPSNASHAHQLLSATHISPEIDSCFDCGIMRCPSGNRAICCEATNSCKCPEDCSSEGVGHSCGTIQCELVEECCQTCNDQGILVPANKCDRRCPQPLCIPSPNDSIQLPSTCHRCCSPNDDAQCTRIRVDCSGCSLQPTVDIGPPSCECGAQCEMLGFGTGVCQEDGQTCAQNILPPNCPVPSTLKQEGESCGYSRRQDCGNCAQGLECDTFVEDACGVCKNKPAQKTKQVGETCGSCFNPEANFDCGKCTPGLECVKDDESDLLQDLPSRCRVTDIRFSLASDCNQCISEFAEKGGCDCMQNDSCDVTALIPEGCFPCGDKAMAYCDSEAEEKSSKCNNPGKSVPSPFDSCNTCRCSDGGVIEGCTKRFCFEEEENQNNNPYDKLLYCKDNNPDYCEENTDGQFNFCHQLYQPTCFVDGEVVKDCYGVCVPEIGRCHERRPCESIGNKDSGELGSKCKNGKCVFSKAIIIA